MAAVSKEEIASLIWARIANDENGVGLYGPSLRKKGPVEQCEDFVKRGMLRVVRQGTVDEMGYWLTDAGRQYLQNSESN